MKDIINEIIKEEINRLIVERASSDILYHFTRFHSLENILSSNSMKCSWGNDTFDDNPNLDKQYNKKLYPYYISFTRSKDSEIGYAGHNQLKVRIEFDGKMLNTIPYSKLIPVSFYYKPKRCMNSLGPVDFKARLKTYNQFAENEDRLVTQTNSIDNILTYIRRIDVQFYNEMQTKSMFTRDTFANLPNEVKAKIFGYYDDKNFRFQTNTNVINLLDFENMLLQIQ